jgi:transcriptional regulator with XRE-family HTH domain
MNANLHIVQGAVKPHFAPDAVAPHIEAPDNREMRIRLRDHRAALGLSLEKLADRTRFSLSQLSRWEKGESNIPSGHLPELAAAYECSVTEIFEDEMPDEASVERAKVISIFSRVPSSQRHIVIDVLSKYAVEG